MSKNIRRIGNYLYIVDYNQSVRENGVWAVCGFTNDILKNRNGQKAYKVILSDNPKLITDGIQEIPADFLEWFVKNSECESVKVKTWIKTFEDGSTFDRMDYELIIPQDQPKQTEVLGYEKKYTAEDMTEYAMYILNNPVITPYEWYKLKHNG